MSKDEVEVLEELSPRRFRLICAYCEGTGGEWDPEKRYHTREPCRVCAGTGASLVRLKGSLPLERCPRCKGKAREKGGGQELCKGCKGSGARPTAGHLEVVAQDPSRPQ